MSYYTDYNHYCDQIFCENCSVWWHLQKCDECEIWSDEELQFHLRLRDRFREQAREESARNAAFFRRIAEERAAGEDNSDEDSGNSEDNYLPQEAGPDDENSEIREPHNPRKRRRNN